MVSAFLLAAAPIAPTAHMLSRPDIHGDDVVFSAEGDLWIGDVKSRKARRITTDPGLETTPKFSPDGRTIAFTGTYDGQSDVYTIPVGGGIPKRLTYGPGSPVIQDWTPDGSAIAFRKQRDPGYVNYPRLYTVPVAGGLVEPVIIPRVEHAAYMPNGNIVYVPLSNEWANWFRYRAGSADDLWMFEPSTKKFTRLTTDEGVDTTPTVAAGQVYFIAERSAGMNLYSLDPGSKRVAQITRNTDNVVRYPASDGKRVVFQNGPILGLYDPATKAVEALDFDLGSDRRFTRTYRVPVRDSIETFALGPAGKRLALTARGSLATAPVESGDFRVLDAANGFRAKLPAWSHDGKRIAYVSDRSGEYEVYVTDSATGEPKRLTNGLASNVILIVWSPDGKRLALQDREGRVRTVDTATGTVETVDQAQFIASYDSVMPSLAFSPDSRLLLYTRCEPPYQFALHVRDLGSGRSYPVSDPFIYTRGGTFSPDGKFVAYLAATSINPAWGAFTSRMDTVRPIRLHITALVPDAASPFAPDVDEEGVEAKKPADGTPPPLNYQLDRISEAEVAVPLNSSHYIDVAWVEGRILVIDGDAPGGDGSGNNTAIALNLKTKRPETVVSGFQDFAFSPDRKRMAYSVGGTISVTDSYTADGRGKPVPMSGYAVEVNPVQEWRQIFAESWRVTRDFFYDPGMNGVDWNAVRTKYEPQLAAVGDRSDLTQLLKDMVSELQTGHAYITNPAPFRPATAVATSFLGVDYAREGNGVKIAKIYQGDGFSPEVRSPLLAPGVNGKVGDFIVSINGRRLTGDTDPQALLLGLAGQVVRVVLNDRPGTEGARTVYVRPLGSEAALRYQDWSRERAAYVAKATNGAIGYMHVPNMVREGYQEYLKSWVRNQRKDATVYDFRYNGGGNISSVLLENLRARPEIWFIARGSQIPWTREDWAPLGGAVAVCNEDNFSDGELIIENWKKIGLGPVVGKRTGGGEVGSGGGYTLTDGGAIYVPNYAAYENGKWVIEGFGATPTVEVDQDPNLVIQGKDPQLDRAIQLAIEEGKRRKIKVPVPPYRKNG